MKCFIHPDKEAMGVCKVCGKGMCDDCSAYSKHSGLCPECRCNGFKEEVILKRQERKDAIWSIIWNILLCITVIWIPVAIFKVAFRIKTIVNTTQRINVLLPEIAKLEKVLNTTGGDAFV